MKGFLQVSAFIVGAILAVNILPGLIAALAGVAPCAASPNSSAGPIHP